MSIQRLLLIAAVAGCTTTAAARSETPNSVDGVEIARIRAEGPAALDRLLAIYDTMPAGSTRDAFALRIDAVAAQRYATESRLYWYTDLDAAKHAAKAAGKPILSLRMLGRLDEDFSCANSRYFRIALYANAELSKFMRDRFILLWSSERAAPRVTVDFGDGRKLERTITGNSAHFVLDEDGRPVDVIPGLYAPAVFRKELETSLELVATLRGKVGHDRVQALSEHHRLQLAARLDDWKAIGSITMPFVEGFRPEAFAQGVTVTKSNLEIPTYRVVDLGVNIGKFPDDAQAWAQVGVRLLPRAAAKPAAETKPGARVMAAASAIEFGTMGQGPPRIMIRSAAVGPIGSTIELPRGQRPQIPVDVGQVLDDRSRSLLARLGPSSWDGANPGPASPAQLAVLVNRFERDILADTAINEFNVRQELRIWFINAQVDARLEQLDRYLYDHVFHTPVDDAWLGLRPAGVTALPNDGLVAPHR